MKEFIWGMAVKVVIIALAIGATGMAMLTLGVVAYAFDIDIFVLLTVIALIAILWQIYEALKRERERKRLDEKLKELRDRAERRRAARGNE
jgi:Na+/proline symporter